MFSTRWTTVANQHVWGTNLRRASWDELTWRVKVADWVHYPQSAAVRYSIALIQTMECLWTYLLDTECCPRIYTPTSAVCSSQLCATVDIKRTRPSFVSRLSWLARCGRWNFLRDTGEVHRIYRPSSLFVYVLICIWDIKSNLTQLSKQKSYSNNRKQP